MHPGIGDDRVRLQPHRGLRFRLQERQCHGQPRRDQKSPQRHDDRQGSQSVHALRVPGSGQERRESQGGESIQLARQRADRRGQTLVSHEFPKHRPRLGFTAVPDVGGSEILSGKIKELQDQFHLVPALSGARRVQAGQVVHRGQHRLEARAVHAAERGSGCALLRENLGENRGWLEQRGGRGIRQHVGRRYVFINFLLFIENRIKELHKYNNILPR